MLIRHAHATADAVACADIYAPFVSDSVASLEEAVPTPEEFSERMNRISQTHAWLVADIKDRVAGFAYASVHRERASYRWAADVSVYVDPAFQRRGVATTLYRELFGLLVRQGYRSACAGITLPNEPSVSLHEALGFELVGVYRRIGYKHGAWRDVGWWQLQLAPGAPDPPAEPSPPVRLGQQSATARD
jgi:phosphinothricin acetyltransferase